MKQALWGSLVVGLLVTCWSPVSSQTPPEPVAPLTSAQREQIGLSIQALGTSLSSLDASLSQCSKSTPSAACVRYAQQRDTMRVMLANLCKEHHVPPGQYGCP